MKNKIVNIGTLDVRQVSEELAKQVDIISNVGMYITNDQSEFKLSEVEKSNVSHFIKTDEAFEVVNVNGSMSLSREDLRIDSKLLVTVNGKLIFDKSLEPKLCQEKIFRGIVNGEMVLPSNLSHIKNRFTCNGKTLIYDEDKTYVEGLVELDQTFLDTYFGDKNIAVSTLIATETLDIDTFEDIMSQIQVLKRLVITKENARILRKYLKVEQNCVTLLPSPVYYLRGDQDLTLDFINTYGDRNIVVEGQLNVADPSALSKLRNFKIQATEIMCPSQLVEEVRSKCLNKQQIIQSQCSGGLENYSHLTIDKNYLERLSEEKQIVNYSEIEIDDSVLDFSGEILMEIENYGHIKMSDKVKPYLLEKITENFGTIAAWNKEQAPHREGVLYANMGYLSL